MSKVMKKIKEQQKALANKIREEKRECGYGGWDLYKMKREFRHKHIAYCEVRGRTREEIEKPGDNNLADEKYIQEIKDKLLKELENEKAVRVAA